MSESLADSFAIASQSLPASLAPRRERDRLLRHARLLAPIHCAGFECRLTGAPGRVDLQQRITPRDCERERLAAYLLASGLCARPAWRRIHDFMLAWGQGELARQVCECWLEYEPAGGGRVRPSVFVSFNRGEDRRDGASALRQALALLAPPAQAQRLADAVQEIGGRLPKGARIYDIGLMARQPAILRVNIGGFAPAQLAAVLASLGWDRRERARIGEFARAAMPYARQCKLAIDWYGKLLRRAGLEIVPGDDPELPATAAARARWRRLLAWLCARNACDAERAAALMDWPGQDEPPGCRTAWPESLVVESLARGPGEFSVMGRRLSHVKVDFRPRQLPVAKAYFGFGRLWRAAPPAERAPVQRAALRAAIARGADFLLAQRAHAAPWKDFQGVQGGSAEWASAYVAAALARNRGSAYMPVARATWTWLAGLRADAGWGFSPLYSADADSTLWALRLAALLGAMRAPCARAALSFMRRHRKRDGGVATFLPETLGASGSAPEAGAVAGWCQAHAEVTAAAGALPGFGNSSAAWLLRAQQRDGRWQAYWYDEDAFATALAAEHLASRGGLAARRALARAARWAASRVAPDGSVAAGGVDGGSAFAAACCLRILLAVPDHDEARRAMTGRLVAWLVAAQRSDGSWPGSVPLRVPLPGDIRPAGLGARTAFSWDERGFFTAATALDALGRAAASTKQDREARVPRRNGAAASASRRGTPAAARPRRSGSRSPRR